MKANSGIANTAYFLIILIAGGYILSIGKTIIVPVIFAIFLSFLLYPICRKLEAKKFPRILAILTTMFSVTLLLSGMILLFTFLFSGLFDDLENFKIRIMATIKTALEWIATVPVLQRSVEPMIKDGGAGLFNQFSTTIGNMLISSTAFIGYCGIVVIYTFLFLLYRSAFKRFILSWFKGNRLNEMEAMLYKFQKVTQSYFGGMFIAIFMIGTINSIGLFFIGVDNAILFGFFASFLAIIPYIGTSIGSLLPALYALVNYDEIWKAIVVLIFFQGVQSLEGNFITPKIVGRQVSINPLVAIVALLVGGVFWGIAGMVLSLPLIALTRVLLDNFEDTKPFAHLLSDKFSEK
ncbi:MAG: AI-2E family transporter [Bacteroidia bacterium]